LAHLPCGHTRTDRVNDADDLVAWHDRLGRIHAQTVDGQHVGMADTTGFDPQPNLTRPRLAQLALDQFKLPDASY